MRVFIALGCMAACVLAGCSYKAGLEQTTVSTEYRGAIKYTAEDISQEKAEWGVVVFRLNKIIGTGCEASKTVQQNERVVPYRLGVESGNFVQGLASTVMLPITLPLFALSGSEGKVLGDHLKTIGNNLNIFQATPPEDTYLLNEPVALKPIGGPRQTGWQPVTEERIFPVEKARVELRIDSLRFGAEEATDENGVVSFDIRGVAGAVAIPEGEGVAEVAAQLIVKDASTSGDLAVIPTTVRIPRRSPAP